MCKKNKLDEAIDTFEAIAENSRLNGDKNSQYEGYVAFLKRLRYLEECIAKGELKWKDLKKDG